jgi:ferredoxin
MRIHVTINPRKCAANQACMALMPDGFELGEAGYSRTRREFDADEVPALRDVEMNCPVAAITVDIEGD